MAATESSVSAKSVLSTFEKQSAAAPTEANPRSASIVR